jgi:hypothetical protein
MGMQGTSTLEEHSSGGHEEVKAKEDKSLLAKLKRSIKSLIPRRVLSFYHVLRYAGPPTMEMHAIKREEVEEFLKINGARVLGVVEIKIGGPEWITYRYCATKQ